MLCDNWVDERGCDEGHWHAHTRGLPWGLPEVVGTVEQVHCSRKRLLRRGLEFHVCTINKNAHTKKSGNLFNDPRTLVFLFFIEDMYNDVIYNWRESCKFLLDLIHEPPSKWPIILFLSKFNKSKIRDILKSYAYFFYLLIENWVNFNGYIFIKYQCVMPLLYLEISFNIHIQG